MDGTERKYVSPGLMVDIVMKQDQRTGRLTSGVVKDVLTKSTYHPHGIKVRKARGWLGAKLMPNHLRQVDNHQLLKRTLRAGGLRRVRGGG
ncbi:MAG TPA: YwbE family protein [Pyrinomonadaceae bacterium]|jgi:uncharacterized repeat protein (TIGR03833 family)